MKSRPPRARMILDRAHRFCCCRFLKSIGNVPKSAAPPGKTRNTLPEIPQRPYQFAEFPIRNSVADPQRLYMCSATTFPIPRVQFRGGGPEGMAQRWRINLHLFGSVACPCIMPTQRVRYQTFRKFLFAHLSSCQKPCRPRRP